MTATDTDTATQLQIHLQDILATSRQTFKEIQSQLRPQTQ